MFKSSDADLAAAKQRWEEERALTFELDITTMNVNLCMESCSGCGLW